MGAGRVVGDNAAHRRAIAAGGIGAELQAMRAQGSVQAVEHDARLHAHPAFLGVELQDLVHVAREVHDQRFADDLADDLVDQLEKAIAKLDPELLVPEED